MLGVGGLLILPVFLKYYAVWRFSFSFFAGSRHFGNSPSHPLFSHLPYPSRPGKNQWETVMFLSVSLDPHLGLWQNLGGFSQWKSFPSCSSCEKNYHNLLMSITFWKTLFIIRKSASQVNGSRISQSSDSQSVSQSVRLSVCLSVCLSICQSVSQSVSQSGGQLVSQSVSQSVRQAGR